MPDPSAVTCAVTAGFEPSEIDTSIVALASPVPSTRTSPSSTALTRPSPSIGVVITGAAGTWLSRVIVSVAAAEVLPAASVCVTDTVSGPLSRPETSSSLPDSVQLPDPSAVTCAVTTGFEPSEIVTSIVALASPVPSTRTSLSSTALTRPSPSIGVVITGAAGAVRS